MDSWPEFVKNTSARDQDQIEGPSDQDLCQESVPQSQMCWDQDWDRQVFAPVSSACMLINKHCVNCRCMWRLPQCNSKELLECIPERSPGAFVSNRNEAHPRFKTGRQYPTRYALDWQRHNAWHHGQGI